MAKINSLPPEQVRLPMSPDYEKIVRSSDDESSFFLSLGIGLLEALIRLKQNPEVSAAAWSQLSEKLSSAAEWAARINAQDKVQVVFSLITLFGDPENDIAQCFAWLEGFTQTNQQEAARGIEVSIRSLLRANAQNVQHPLRYLKNDSFHLQDDKIQLQRLCDSIGFHVALVSSNANIEYITKTDGKKAPLVSLYHDGNNVFAVAYHKLHLNFAKGSNQNTDEEPFMYIPSENKIQLANNSALPPQLGSVPPGPPRIPVIGGAPSALPPGPPKAPPFGGVPSALPPGPPKVPPSGGVPSALPPGPPMIPPSGGGPPALPPGPPGSGVPSALPPGPPGSGAPSALPPGPPGSGAPSALPPGPPGSGAPSALPPGPPGSGAPSALPPGPPGSGGPPALPPGPPGSGAPSALPPGPPKVPPGSGGPPALPPGPPGSGAPSALPPGPPKVPPSGGAPSALPGPLKFPPSGGAPSALPPGPPQPQLGGPSVLPPGPPKAPAPSNSSIITPPNISGPPIMNPPQMGKEQFTRANEAISNIYVGEMEDLVCTLSIFIMNSGNDRENLKKVLNAYTEKFPQLRGKAEVLGLLSFLEKCPHKSGKSITPVCGQVHCAECLYERVKNCLPGSAPRCDHGQLSPKNINDLKEMIGKPEMIPERNSVPMNRVPEMPVMGENPRNTFPANNLGGVNQILRETKICKNCERRAEKDEFEVVSCKDHDVCSRCHSLQIKTGENACPICKREYGDTELVVLQITAAEFFPDENVTLATNETNFWCNRCRKMKHVTNKNLCRNGCNVCTQCTKDMKNVCYQCKERVNDNICAGCNGELEKKDYFQMQCGHPVHPKCQRMRCTMCHG